MVARPRTTAKMALNQVQSLEFANVDDTTAGGGLRRRQLLARRLLPGLALPVEALGDAAAAAKPTGPLGCRSSATVPCPSRQQMHSRPGNPHTYSAQYYVAQQPHSGFPSAAINGRK